MVDHSLPAVLSFSDLLGTRVTDKAMKPHLGQVATRLVGGRKSCRVYWVLPANGRTSRARLFVSSRALRSVGERAIFGRTFLSQPPAGFEHRRIFLIRVLTLRIRATEADDLAPA
jgi:hypothetical protein